MLTVHAMAVNSAVLVHIATKQAQAKLYKKLSKLPVHSINISLQFKIGCSVGKVQPNYHDNPQFNKTGFKLFYSTKNTLSQRELWTMAATRLMFS